MRPEPVILIFFPIPSHAPYHRLLGLSTQRKAQTNNVTLMSPYKTNEPTHSVHKGLCYHILIQLAANWQMKF